MTHEEVAHALAMLTDPSPHLRLSFARAMLAEAPHWLPPAAMDELRDIVTQAEAEIAGNPTAGAPPIPRLRLASVDGRRTDENS